MDISNGNNTDRSLAVDPVKINEMIYVLRGQKVMLDKDLAEIYGYEVKNLNRQVKNNIERFPSDFMFQITQEEADYLRCNFCTANLNPMSRTLPYVFTEQGVYMLATVLKGDIAVNQSIGIIRAFREMRHLILQNQQFVSREELIMITDSIETKTREIALRQDETDKQIKNIQGSIESINESFMNDNDYRNYIIFKGQKFEADKAHIDIYKKAQKSIFIIDNYVNTKTLHLLSHKNPGVLVILFTENGFGRRGFLSPSEIEDFRDEYPPFQIKPNPYCHDRFIVLDYNTKNEKVYHCGSSSKDAGNKVCAINCIENTQLIHPVIDGLLSNTD